MAAHLRRCAVPAVVVAVAAVALTVPPAAAAGVEISRTGSTITIVGTDGPDVIRISSQRARDTIVDDAGILAGGGCDQVTPTEAMCGDIVDGLTLQVSLGAGDDRFSWTAVQDYATIDGGPGNDEIEATSGNDTINGGDGNDTIYGLNGNDTIDGGPGNDNITGGQDDDTITGGPGTDTINSDGTNNAGGNWFGNDTVYVRDGERDVVTCGFGTDTVSADTQDVFDSEGSCESIDRAGVSPGGTPSTVPLKVAVSIAAKARIAAVAKSGFPFKLTISRNCDAVVAVVLPKSEAKRVLKLNKDVLLWGTRQKLTAGAYNVKGGKLAAKYVKPFTKAKPVKVIVGAQCTTSDGKQKIAGKVVALS